jgi:hypothetical protein
MQTKKLFILYFGYARTALVAQLSPLLLIRCVVRY